MSFEGFRVDDFIYDADSGNFHELVLNKSTLGPVLVHFRSRQAVPGFGPHPVLENLVERYRGSFVLANVDVDAQRAIARDYAITSVPTLKLFVQQQVVATQVGIQQEQDLRFMLDQHVASEFDRIIHDALQQFHRGNTEAAYQTLGQAALDAPGYYKLPLAIERLMASEGRFEDALKLLHALPQSIRELPLCRRRIIELEFAWIAAPVQQADELQAFVAEHPQEIPATAMLAAWWVTRRDYRAALAGFHAIMQQDPDFENNLGRRSIIKILQLLERENPLAVRYRKLLQQMENPGA